jgi:hypothetical protein
LTIEPRIILLVEADKQRVAALGRDPDRLSFVGGVGVGEVDEITRRLQRGHHVTERDQADAARRRATTAEGAIQEIGRAGSAGFTHLGVTLGWTTVAELVEKLEWFATTVMGET